MNRAMLLLFGLLSACAARAPLERVAIEQNALVARTTNEVMLLNIVRAMQRQPMHFTSLSALHGNVTLSAGISAGATLPSLAVERGGGGETYSPSISASVSTNPSFDIAINDSQEFYQGFLHPIEPATVAHFLDDGWPSDLITYLLVRRVEFVASKTDSGSSPRFREGQVVGSLFNTIGPESEPGFLEFARCIQLKAGTSQDSDTPLVALLPLTQLANIERLDGAQFDVKVDKATNVAMLHRKGGTSVGIELVDLGRTGTPEQKARCIGFRGGASVAPIGAQATFQSSGIQKPAPGAKSDATTGSQPNRLEGTYFLKQTDPSQPPLAIPVAIQITLRSPEAVMYFLGEYIRADMQGKATAPLFKVHANWPFDADCREGEDHPLLLVRTERPTAAVMSVRLDGVTYYIPKAGCGSRSMEIITLVEQLVNLQKSSRDKVGTQSVRLIQ